MDHHLPVYRLLLIKLCQISKNYQKQELLHLINLKENSLKAKEKAKSLKCKLMMLLITSEKFLEILMQVLILSENNFKSLNYSEKLHIWDLELTLFLLQWEFVIHWQWLLIYFINLEVLITFIPLLLLHLTVRVLVKCFKLLLHYLKKRKILIRLKLLRIRIL